MPCSKRKSGTKENNITHERVCFSFLSSPPLLPFVFGAFSVGLREGSPCLDMAFLFLTLIASLLNGGQLHRLMVGKRPYFFSLEVVRLYDFNQGIQQHAMLPFSGRVHSFEMDVERRGCEFTGGRPSYRDAARSQSTARTAVERWCVSGSIVCGRHSHLVVVQGGDGDAGIAHTALHACTFVVTPHLLQGPAYAYSSL